MSDMTEGSTTPVGLVGLIGALGAAGRRLFARRLAQEAWVTQAGLRAPAYGVLLTIERLGPVSQRQISDQMGLDASDLVGVIDILEREGFLTRGRDPEDRRRYSLTLTALGRQRLGQFSIIAAEVEEELLAPLDDDERRTFHLLVQRVLEHQRQPEPGGR
jgi:DNA-binding MarR family transcriptional regulator